MPYIYNEAIYFQQQGEPVLNSVIASILLNIYGIELNLTFIYFSTYQALYSRKHDELNTIQH